MNDIEKIQAIAKAMQGGNGFVCSVATTGDEWRLSFAGFSVTDASLHEAVRKFRKLCVGLQREAVAIRLDALQVAEAAMRAIEAVPEEPEGE